MSTKLPRIIVLLILSAMFEQFIFAKDSPATAGQLRTAFESALKARDTNAFAALFDWNGVAEDQKALRLKMLSDLMRQDVSTARVKLARRPANYSTASEFNGVHYSMNRQISGLIQVQFGTNGVVAELPFGVKDSTAQFASAVAKKPKKILNAFVTSVVSPEILTPDGKYICPTPAKWQAALAKSHITYEGTLVYWVDGKQITKDLHEKMTGYYGFQIDRFESCAAKRTSKAGWLKLTVQENGQTTYDSGWVGDGSAIAYKQP